MHLSSRKPLPVAILRFPYAGDTVPPGVPVMKEMAGKIRYKYEETTAGGRVVMRTTD